MVGRKTSKMTLLLWIGLFGGLNAAHAGWEYSESARPKKKRGAFPKPSAESAPESESIDEAPSAPPARVQVFGKPAAEMSADDYARMLKEDQAAVGEASDESDRPVVSGFEASSGDSGIVSESSAAPESTRAPEPGVEAEFEALRARLRTRKVAESAGETRMDSENASASARRFPAKSAPARAGVKPPPPALETEVITPQRAAGKKVKNGKTEPALEPEAPRGSEVNAAFPYTHLLPSPFNLPQGGVVFGTTIAYGVLDFLQVSTNVARMIQQQWNFQAKVPLVEYPTFVASAFVDYQTSNPHHYDDTNPDTWIKRWQPGLVTGYEITPDVAFFLGGNFDFGKEAPPIVTTSGYLKGAQVNAEWSWLYNPSTSRLGNNALALGIKYDFTYSLFGFGFTHHWRNFELGVHYTFADRSRFLPIAGFSFGSSF